MSRSRAFRRPWSYLIVLSILVLSASATWFAIPRGASGENDAGGLLAVELVSPRGEVGKLPSIDVVFSETMIPLGGRGKAKKQVPLTLDPPIEGSFSWIGTRLLTFVPRETVPEGTRLTCRVPEGTRSLEDRILPGDYAWEIVVGRPRLIRSVPEEEEVIAPDAAIHLLFSLDPAAGAERSVRLVGPRGEIALERIVPDSAASQIRHRREEGSGGILALRPAGPLDPGATYRLTVEPSIPFRGSAVGLIKPYEFAFRTYGAPLLQSAEVGRDEIMLTLLGPVDPDSLRDHLEVFPEISNLAVHAASGTRFRVEGRIRRGTTYSVRILPGLTTLLGERLLAEQRGIVATPHLRPELTISPSSGYVPRLPGATIRIEGTNVDTVEVLGRWVHPDSVASRLAAGRDGRRMVALPRIALWVEPRQGPDSAHAVQIPLARFGERPNGPQVLQVRLLARPLFPDRRDSSKGPTRFTDDAFLQITDLGLSVVIGEEGGIAWVTRLSTGQPLQGAELLIHDPNQSRPLWRGITDGEGLAWTPGTGLLSVPASTPLIAEARTGKDAAWLTISHGRIDRRSGWDGGGERTRAYLATDRPLYRPGETVRWVVLARRTGREGIDPADLGAVGYVIEATRSRQIAERGRVLLTPPGNGAGSFTIPSDALPETYRIYLTEAIDGTSDRFASQSFSVEEYRLPRFEAHLSAPAAPAISGSPVVIEGRFSYLGGGPLAGAPIRWTIQRHPDWSRPKGYEGFSFLDPRPPGRRASEDEGWMVRVASGEGRLDREGRIRLPVTPSLDGLGQEQVYILEMGARDLADRSAYDAITFPARRATVQLGARAQSLAANKNRSVEFAAVVLDSTGHPAAGIPLRWAIERREWKTVRVRRIGGVFGYENVPRDSTVHAGGGASGPEPLRFEWIPPAPGTYSFVVRATDPLGRVTTARSDVHVSGRSAAAWRRDDSGWLDLEQDRPAYSAGDTARVLLPAPAIPTEGLFLVLDGGIRSVQRLRRVQGSPRLEIPLSGSYPPGVHLQAILVGPSSVPQGDEVLRRLPYYGHGQTFLEIEPAWWRLDLEVAAEREVYEPGQEVATRIVLRNAQGKPVAGTATVAVVDDAIFELTGEERWDPLATMFPYRGTGTEYADLREDLHLPAVGEKGSLSPGGDGAGEGAGIRRRFVSTVHWEPVVPVDASGTATVRFKLADDLTRYRIRVLGTSGADLFGYGEAKFDVRKPLQLEWGAPRFAHQGDRIEIAAVVRNHSDRKITATVEAEAIGARIDGKEKVKVRVEPSDGGRTVFRLKEIEEGVVTLRLRATGDGLGDAAEIEIPIDRPVVWDRAFQSGRVDPMVRTTITSGGGALPEMGGLTTVVSPTMLGGFEDALDYVVYYPYGCLEQLSSTLLGIIAHDRIDEHLGIPNGPAHSDRHDRASEAIQGIDRCVQPWEIRSWPSEESSPASDYVVGYTLYAAVRARESRFDISRHLVDRLADETEGRLRRLWREAKDAKGIVRLLREGPWLLWALSEADRLQPPDSLRVRVDDAESLFSRRSAAPLESKIMLGLTFANLQHHPDGASVQRNWPTLSDALVEEIKGNNMERTGRYAHLSISERSWGDGIGSHERATALFLRLLSTVDPADQDLPGIVAWLVFDRGFTTGTWSNNHTTALTLDLLMSTLHEIEGPRSEVSGNVAVGNLFEEFRFTGKGGPPFRKQTPIGELVHPDGTPIPTQLRIETDGRRTVYYTATLDEARPSLDEPAREEGMIIDRSYVDTQGNRYEDLIPLGEPLFVHVTVVVSRDATSLVVEDPLPAGVEALNLRFQNSPVVSMSSGPEERGGGPDLRIVHRELRDRSVRLFAEGVQAGIYQIYYPAIAATAGIYRVPGARAEFLYSPEIYATSAPRTIRIKRTDR